MDHLSLGKIITFYSYKGGTGRSMALANVACLLAQNKGDGQKVLMVDWDLEAPGLHRFFQGRLKTRKNQTLEMSMGVIDLFYAMQKATETREYIKESPDRFFESLGIERYILETDIESLFLMPAGRLDKSYPTRVSKFDWEGFFDKNPWLLSEFAKYLATKFRYVLIDSRTGFTDISSVCTSIMPEQLVLVFTPNRQSLTGVLDLIESVTNYRKRSDDVRPLIVFPLVSRVENAEEKLLEDWRFGNKSKGISGYQPQFEEILKEAYSLTECNLTQYFDEVIIQHVPRYSYGEELAILSSRRDDRLSLVQSYEKLTERLTEASSPWDEVSSPISLQRKLSDDITVEHDNKIAAKVEEQRLKIFMVHASNDKPIVRELYQSLRAESWIDPWLDEEKLLPGQAWDVEIDKAVQNADAVLVCLSNNSVTKEGYIQKEIRYALDKSDERPQGQVFVIPIRIEDCQVPSRLKSWQWLDYFPEDRRETAFGRLLESLRLRAKLVGVPFVEQSNNLISPSLAKIRFGESSFASIPSGTFRMGSNDIEDAGPEHLVSIPYDYWISETLTTNSQYASYAKDKRVSFKTPAGKALHPVVGLSWHEVQSYLLWLNETQNMRIPQGYTFRLPTEAEWEKAARGSTGLLWPWGNTFDSQRCNSDDGGERDTTPVGKYSPEGDSPYGVTDMAGNVWEWTNSIFKPYPYDATDGRENPRTLGIRVVRGGSYITSQHVVRCAFRSEYELSNQNYLFNVGFRVAIAPIIS